MVSGWCRDGMGQYFLCMGAVGHDDISPKWNRSGQILMLMVFKMAYIGPKDLAYRIRMGMGIISLSFVNSIIHG